VKNAALVRRILPLMACIILIAVSSGLGQAAPRVEKMNLAHVLASSHPCHQALIQFAEAVEKETNGRIQISIISGGALGGEKDEIDQIKMGALDFALLYGVSLFQGMAPVTAIEELPFLWSSREQAYAAYDGELGAKLTEAIGKNGVRVLAYWENGFRHFTNNVKPIVRPADMKSIKFRTAESAIRLDMFKQLGAAAVPMPFTELFTALQQGTVDGQENPLSIIDSSRLYEVQKYLSLSGHIWNASLMVVSPGRWNKLSAEDRKVIEANALKYRLVARELIREQDDKLLTELKAKGIAVNEVDKAAFKKAVEPVWAKYEAKFGKDIMDIVRKYSGN